MVLRISVVVPVFNSEASLAELISRLANTLPTLTSKYEVVLVNDGNHDASWARICALADQYDWVRGINLMRSEGNTTRCCAASETHAKQS